MQAAIQSYYNVRTANALDLAVAQVEMVNRLEENHQHDLAGEDAHSVRLTGSSAYLSDEERRFDVSIERGRVFVGWRDEGSRWSAEVLADGSLDYRAGR